MILFQHRIYRQDLRANPDVTYVFGDNNEGEGYGGQAGEMRGEPNAVGVPTKRRPGMEERDFYTDDHLFDNQVKIDAAIGILVDELLDGKVVVLPLDGLGTGLAQLEQRAPQTFAYLQEKIEHLKKIGR